MKKKKEKKISAKAKKNINIVSAIIYFLFCFISLLLTINIFKLNMLPFKITFLIFLFGIICLLVFGFLILHKKIKWKIKIISDIFLVIISLVLFFANHYLDKTISFFKNITDNNFEVENYYVLALKESSLSSEKDLLDKKIGYVGNLGNNDEALDILKESISFEVVNSKSIFDLGNSLLEKKVEGILVADYHKSILDEQIKEFNSKVKIIYEFSIKKESTIESTTVDVTKDSFHVYLSGIDTYGQIDSIARSDVNMVVTVNPVTKQVLLTSIPRDYYVDLSCYNAKDKLTHAGMYGIDCSVGTIENLLGIDINYYIRVNFSSLINIVDVLGGINVYSEYTFRTGPYQFYKGYNYLNGEYALAFSRERYNFIDGDRQRVKNQQAVITAIVNKAMSPVILSKYTSILDALKDSFQTNMGMSEIQSLAKFQIDKMPKWNISSISLNGADSSGFTYSYGDQLLYVMEPYIETIDYAKETIKKVSLGQQIDIESSVTEPVSQNAPNRMTTTTKNNKTSTTSTTTTTATTTNDDPNEEKDEENKITTTTTTTKPITTTQQITTTIPTTTITTTTVANQNNNLEQDNNTNENDTTNNEPSDNLNENDGEVNE